MSSPSTADPAQEPESTTPTVNEVEPESQAAAASSFTKGSIFWLSFISILVSVLLAALDLTAVATILPTLTDDLNGGDDFTWVGSAYALASAAILPLIGGLSDSFGRKPVMIACIILFCLGSALAGAAQTMNMMIGARTVQGLGGGGVATVTQIIVADLVPLNERGLYQGYIGLVYSLAAGIGPITGGVFAQLVTWRWLFYLNLPIGGISLILVILFLRVKSPPGSFKEKIAKIDWFGNLIVIAGTTLAIIGLTWGGTRYPWDSAHVLAPLIIGLVLLGLFVVYEAYVPKVPTIPFRTLNNSTTISGYIGTFTHGITSISLIYYLPVYFQACLDASPIRSGVDGFPNAFLVAPCAFLAGIWIRYSKHYRMPNAVGWILAVVGFGLLSLLKNHSTTGERVGYQVVVSIGTGLIFGAPIFPILAPLPPSAASYGVAFFSFLRTFANTWGITISSTILQNQLKQKLPEAFVAQFPEGTEIAYAAIPQIRHLPEPLQTQVKDAFASSLSTVWETMIGIAGIGVLSLLLMKDIPLGSVTNEKYGLDVKKPDEQATGEKQSEEKAGDPVVEVV